MIQISESDQLMPDDMHILGVLKVDGPMSNKTLAAKVRDVPHRTYQALYLLVRKGWVGHERRGVYRITEMGEQVLAGRDRNIPAINECEGMCGV
jgi:hypothetical protein